MCAVTVLQGYGASFILQYVQDSGAGGDMNVGELWSDMQWDDGGEPAVADPPTQCLRHSMQRSC